MLNQHCLDDQATTIEEVDVTAGFIIGSTCCSLELEEDEEEDAGREGVQVAVEEETLEAAIPQAVEGLHQ